MSKGSQDNLLSGKSSTNLSLFCCDTVSTGGSTFTTPITTTSTTDSTSTTTGSIITAGGIGIGKSVYMGGKLHVTDSTQSTTINTGCIQATGGVGIVKNLHVGGTAHITDTTDTTTGLDGSLFTNGGLGVAKSLFVAGDTASTSTGTGALIVTGGAGIDGTVTASTFANYGGDIITYNVGITTYTGSGAVVFTSGSTTIKSTGYGPTAHLLLETYQGNIDLSPGLLTGGNGAGYGEINCTGTLNVGTSSTLCNLSCNEVRKSTATVSGTICTVPLSLLSGESIDVRFSLQQTALGFIKIYAGTATTILEPKTSEVTGATVLSAATADNLTYGSLNTQVQTFTITVTRDSAYYLFYMSGVMFCQTGTAKACTFAGYIDAPQTQFSLAPASGTFSGWYRTSKYTA